jgi:acyl-CoA synthetase (AMP-forming)/AMP-acid ligase II
LSASPYLLHHLLDGAAGNAAEAIVHGERRLTYADLVAAARNCAGELVAAGLGRGDRAVIFLPRGVEECWAIFGVSMAQGVFVPINALLKAPQVRHIVADCEATVVISSKSLAEIIEPALDGLENVHLIYVEDMGQGAGEPAPRDVAIGEDLAAILYTSGSTGLPKGVMLSHRNLLAGTHIVRTYLGITARDRILSVLPFSFDYGLNQLLTAVEQKAGLVILTFRFGDEIVRVLRDEAITAPACPRSGPSSPRGRRSSAKPNCRVCATSPIQAAGCLPKRWQACAASWARPRSISCTGSPRHFARLSCRPRTSKSAPLPLVAPSPNAKSLP